MPQGAFSAIALGRGPAYARGRPAAPARPLTLAVLCLLGLVLVWVLAMRVPAARVRDGLLLHEFTLLDGRHVDRLGSLLVHSVNPAAFALWAGALICIALARGLPRTALAVAALMGLALLTAETLKPILAEPREYMGTASWPSGHATAAAALALAAVLVTPSRLRPLIAGAGLLFAGAVGCALLILDLHMPSDVLAGYLLAGLWAALIVAAQRWAEHRWPARGRLRSGAG